MFIKLTNAAKEFDGEILVLHSRYIVSVFSTLDADNNPVTVVYGALQSGWHVKESVDKVLEMLNGG